MKRDSEANKILTAEGTALYDRQIRLWGVEAQQRLGRAKILLIGLTAVQAEICKNLVLAGVRHVVVNDNKICTEDDVVSHLFLSQDSVGQNRAEASLHNIQQLNTHVQVSTSNVPLDQIDLSPFDLCCVSGVPISQSLISLNERAKHSGTFFLACDTHGKFGYYFEYLGDSFQWEKEKERIACPPYSLLGNAMIAKLEGRSNPLYVALRCTFDYLEKNKRPPSHGDIGDVLAIHSMLQQQYNVKFRFGTVDFVSDFVRNLEVSLAPVCAILGGVVAQEILKVICRNDQPFRNFMFYNGMDDSANIEDLFLL